MADEASTTSPARGPGRQRAAVIGVAAAVLAIAVPVALRNGTGSPAVPEPAAATRPPPAGLAVAAQPTTFDPNQPPAITEEPPPPTSSAPTGAAMIGVKEMPDPSACPVTAAQLLETLRASDLEPSLRQTGRLTDVQCHGDHAAARTASAATVAFRYTETTVTWEAIGGGTSRPCAGIPQPDRIHLTVCGS